MKQYVPFYTTEELESEPEVIQYQLTESIVWKWRIKKGKKVRRPVSTRKKMGYSIKYVGKEHRPVEYKMDPAKRRAMSQRMKMISRKNRGKMKMSSTKRRLSLMKRSTW